MMLVERERTRPRRARRRAILPEWAAAAKSDPDPAWRARVTVRMLLLHDSGLPAHRDFFTDRQGHTTPSSRA